MKSDQATLFNKIKDDLMKALGHLKYSLTKSLKILTKTTFTEDDLESLEGFGSRFARASDIVIQRYFRLKALSHDPGFRGSVVDILNVAEKEGWISSAEIWRRVRELRNVTAHEYSESEIRDLYTEMTRLAPLLLDLIRDLDE